ncbi:very long chain fatty acid elongase 6 [Anabrus simplex]|uniref:very long chain fatty acid elongase 6 n=1 Tax=Anabrus simplex TaxID=316456 RepID=UPI0034DCF070
MNYMEVTLPNYSYVFNFEEEFEHQDTRVWMIKNWTNGFYFCGIYMILIFGGQHYMQSRPRFELRGVLSLWNTALAAFSLLGACRTAPEFFHVLKNYGLYHSVCIPSFIEQDRVSGFWTWMFVLSKLPELGDTVFIVLRKQPLIFLHWYHHITVLLYSWYSYTEYTASARWFIVMNYCVHSIMYMYYALRSMGYSPPRAFAMLITTCQLTQMIIGCAVNIWAHQILESGQQECHISRTNIKLSIAMYFSYFVLFARFFYKAYFANGKKSKSVTTNGITSTKYVGVKAKIH